MWGVLAAMTRMHGLLLIGAAGAELVESLGKFDGRAILRRLPAVLLPAVGSLACDFIADFRWSFFFSGLNMGIACYLTGLNRSLQAVGMALSRSLVFPALFLSLFALWLEDEHIFWAIPLAEALTLLLGIGLLVHGRRRTGW